MTASLSSGEGWSTGPNGTQVWGRYGAAGLFLVADAHVLLQHRAGWTSMGDTWGIPGGAIEQHEDPVAGALRETCEECGIAVEVPTVLGQLVTAGPFPVEGWTYTTVIATAPEMLATTPNAESYELRWVPLATLAEPQSCALDLLPPFAASLPSVLAATQRLLGG